ASRDSIDLVFEPGGVTGGHYRFAIGTAGATGLVLQTVYLPLALATDAPSEITLEGGYARSIQSLFSFPEHHMAGLPGAARPADYHADATAWFLSARRRNRQSPGAALPAAGRDQVTRANRNAPGHRLQRRRRFAGTHRRPPGPAGDTASGPGR